MDKTFLQKYREEMEKVKELYGWDDGKIYFQFDEQNVELCVTDEEPLYQQLIDFCKNYYKRKFEEQNK